MRHLVNDPVPRPRPYEDLEELDRLNEYLDGLAQEQEIQANEQHPKGVDVNDVEKLSDEALVKKALDVEPSAPSPDVYRRPRPRSIFRPEGDDE